MDFKKIRWYQLEKQSLIRKAESGQYTDMLREHIGLHSTDYLTPYLSLRARVANFDPKALFDDLNIHRNAVRMRAFRGTVFIVHKDNVKALLGGSKYYLAPRLKENTKTGLKFGVDFDFLEPEIASLLSGGRRLTAGEIKKELAGKTNGDHIQFGLRVMDLKGIIVRTGQRHINDRTIKYGLMKDWITDISFDDTGHEKALDELILKYIRKFGPVCLEDICWWFPLPKMTVRKSLENLSDNVTGFKFNDKEYFMERDDYLELTDFEPPEIHEPVINFLPYEDHFPKAYCIRNWYLPAESEPLVFVKERKTDYGQIRPSIWVNGEIIGRWELEWADKAKTSMRVDIIDINNRIPAAKPSSVIIENKRRKLEDFLNEKLVPLMR